MNFRGKIIALLATVRTVAVNGCSFMPPCGIVAKDFGFTDKPGIINIVLIKYEKCSFNPYEGNFRSRGELDRSKIEVDIETGIVRTLSGLEELPAVFPNGLNTLSTVDQSGYDISFMSPTASVIVTGEKFGSKELLYELPGFVRESAQYGTNIISFYSERMERMFFIYTNNEKYNHFLISSCPTNGIDGAALCVTTDTTLWFDFYGLKHDRSGIRVYDSLQLIGIPNGHSCGGYSYYSFDETTPVKSVDTLNSLISPVDVDSRTAVAYSIKGGGNKGIKIVTEKILSNGGIPIMRTKTKKVKISKSLLKSSFTGP
mmetsp:Transcript_32745/g.64883  ORF Transcript_32745/g.64883 Transcript_32745/m.64883 type:complete len:315 (-) Transcript_32745:164-1108(-)|eukprot:CAMPEP_0194333602 /NCGR_PEP_ID=MMETSP0171-20130528/63237_1 /TAXON_ID=218684 /ORGANISM="Corethron pennatum, Strain L29A3" /LENGTH=314 /DNA_ID=CAMNT_0039095899 /DNA_START=112 /DNA_END=1056 /DNA_ORIENTATION=+